MEILGKKFDVGNIIRLLDIKLKAASSFVIQIKLALSKCQYSQGVDIVVAMFGAIKDYDVCIADVVVLSCKMTRNSRENNENATHLV